MAVNGDGSSTRIPGEHRAGGRIRGDIAGVVRYRRVAVVPSHDLIGGRVSVRTFRVRQVEGRQAAAFTRHPPIIVVVIGELSERAIVETERSELGIGVISVGGGDCTSGNGFPMERRPNKSVVSVAEERPAGAGEISRGVRGRARTAAAPTARYLPRSDRGAYRADAASC